MKDEDVVDEIEPTPFPTLSKVEGTAMKTFLIKLAPLCSVHEVKFLKVVEEHELGTEEDLGRMADFVHAKPLYNV